jgi:hypothetical protein
MLDKRGGEEKTIPAAKIHAIRVMAFARARKKRPMIGSTIASATSAASVFA